MWRAPFFVSLALLSLLEVGFAAPRQHTVSLGKWRTVKISEAAGSQQVRIRQLIVDGRIREYTAGSPHDITDRLFVIRRAQRLNDSLPEESAQPPRWIWRLDGWISVDRQTGHITQLNLPAFDPELSQVNWYQDYAAYCGSSDDGSKAYMVVFQLGKRKPLLKKEFTGTTCPAPEWERIPSRVTFNVVGEKNSFVVRARGAGLQPDPNNEEEGPQ
jgi:hypothetical protein